MEKMGLDNGKYDKKSRTFIFQPFAPYFQSKKYLNISSLSNWIRNRPGRFNSKWSHQLKHFNEFKKWVLGNTKNL